MQPESLHIKSIVIFLALGVIFLLCGWFVSPPGDFKSGAFVNIPEGRGLGEIAQILHDEHLVRSPLMFRIFTILVGGERTLKAGQYYFSVPVTAPILAWRISRGEHRIATAKLTVPEGFTVAEISDLFDERFAFFDHVYFKAKASEGYLFPDTYFVPITASASSTIKLMRDNFDRKIEPLLPEIIASKRTLADTINMASLLEAEGKTKVDKEMIADILWKRLKLGMPLQVDSEMWTYEFQGLPNRPINNPGLVSISAAIHPTTTPYLYFLTGKDGKMHYARTFDEHQTNINKYLR